MLLFDVLADDADGRAAARSGKVGRRPQHAFPVSPHQGRMALPHEAAEDALEAVHQGRHGPLGRIVHQQVDVIILAIHLHQLRLEVGADRREDGAHVVQHGLGEDLDTCSMSRLYSHHGYAQTNDIPNSA